jgi:nucleoside-diphosphate-sugar epimerase
VSRYLVTGCAGFIGSRLVDALLDRGEEVTGVDAFTNFYPRVAKEGNLDYARKRDGFSLVEADLVDVALEPLVSEVAGVFHLAARPGVRGSWGASFRDYVRDNLLVSQRLFETAAEESVRVVFASSSSVYGDAETYPTPEDARPRPVSPYGVTKLACEHLARTYATVFGLDVVSLRYFSVYGPRQRPDMAFSRIIAAVLGRKPFQILGSGEQSRDFTYVDDVISANVAAMDRAPAGAVYNVGGGSEVSLREAIDLCQQVSGRPIEVRHDPAVEGDASRTAADTSLIHADLDWKPRTDLTQGLSAQFAWAEGKPSERP